MAWRGNTSSRIGAPPPTGRRGWAGDLWKTRSLTPFGPVGYYWKPVAMIPRLAPADIQLFGSELAIKWNDGAESYLDLKKMRLACPCATCSGESDALGRVYKGEVHYDPERSFKMASYSMVGGYAFQPTWEDGHGTGLYTFPLLRELGGDPGAE